MFDLIPYYTQVFWTVYACLSVYIVQVTPPLDFETAWTEDCWSKTYALKYQNLEYSISSFQNFLDICRFLKVFGHFFSSFASDFQVCLDLLIQKKIRLVLDTKKCLIKLQPKKALAKGPLYSSSSTL